MSSISTKTGDSGQTGLAGGTRVSKGSLRVESYGTVDELTSAMGFARSICDDAEIAARLKLSDRMIRMYIAQTQGTHVQAGFTPEEFIERLPEVWAQDDAIAMGLVTPGVRGSGTPVTEVPPEARPREKA